MNRSLNYVKLIILTSIVIMQLLSITIDKLVVYVVLLLAFILNHQLKKYFTSKPSYIVFLFIDLLILILLAYAYAFTNIFLILITLIDTILNLDQLLTRALLAITSVFGYFIYANLSYRTPLYILFYLVFLILILIFKSQIKENSNLHFLYDDIRKYSYKLERAKSQIEKYSQEVSELSRIKERNRIAEELHDTIGHRLTSLLYQAQACNIALDNNDSTGTEMLERIIESLRENIILLRDKVKNVEVKSYKSFKSSLIELIEEFKNNIPIDLSFNIEGKTYKISSAKETVLFNNLREALTNIARHSHAESATIRLIYTPNSVILIIKDNGIAEEPIVKGYGIRAMETRTELVGGKMSLTVGNGLEITFIISV